MLRGGELNHLANNGAIPQSNTGPAAHSPARACNHNPPANPTASSGDIRR